MKVFNYTYFKPKKYLTSFFLESITFQMFGLRLFGLKPLYILTFLIKDITVLYVFAKYLYHNIAYFCDRAEALQTGLPKKLAEDIDSTLFLHIDPFGSSSIATWKGNLLESYLSKGCPDPN